MTTIISKRHPVKFYTLLIFVFLFTSALGTLFLAAGLNLFQEQNPEKNDYFLSIFSLAFYFLGFALIYSYSKNSPKISLDKQTITIGEERFYLKDIDEVILTGKMPFRFIIRHPMEGTALIFKDGTEKFIYDDMFSNSWEIKSFLEQTVIRKAEYRPNPIPKIDKNSLRFERFETFKRNQLFSFRGIMLWGLIGFFAFMMISNHKSPTTKVLIFFASFGIFWFFINSWLMHFFCIGNDHFIVKNHNLFWVTNIYRLTDIKEVVFETQGKQPNSLRIITKDFKNKLYPAGTLRDDDWLEMKRRLEMKGVEVRNECIPEG